MTLAILASGNARGIVHNEIVHVFKRSSSRYGMRYPGGRLQYCCQDGCCDRGLQWDVETLVDSAKALGAKKVVIRTGQRSYYVGAIAGLPVEDVTRHVGSVGDGLRIDRAW